MQRSVSETVSESLYRGSGDMLTTTTFEPSSQIILIWKCPLALILMPDGLKHLVIELARLCQACHEQARLVLIRIQSKLKRSHIYVLPCSMRIVKRAMAALRRPFIPVAEARGPLAAFLVEKGS